MFAPHWSSLEEGRMTFGIPDVTSVIDEITYPKGGDLPIIRIVSTSKIGQRRQAHEATDVGEFTRPALSGNGAVPFTPLLTFLARALVFRGLSEPVSDAVVITGWFGNRLCVCFPLGRRDREPHETPRMIVSSGHLLLFTNMIH